MKKKKHKTRFIPFHHEMPSGREIITVQVCPKCRREFAFKPNRNKCPYCGTPLKIKTKVLTRKTVKKLEDK